MVRWSLCACGFPVLVGTDLCLDCVPVDLDISRILLELVNVLFFRVLLQESGTVSDDSVDMCLVVECYIEGSLPAVELDVHFNGSIEEASLDQDLLCLVHLFAVHGKGCIASGLRREFLDVIYKLDLVCLVNGGQCNFDCVKLSAVDAHGSETCPESVFLDKAAQSDTLFEISFVDVLIKNLGVRRD